MPLVLQNEISRRVNLLNLLEHKSHMLFGPRQTGKSWLIRETLKDSICINLLELDTFVDYNARPQLLRERVGNSNKSIVVIDEIQKLPILLNEVHNLIETRGTRFLLTGSSARSLRKKGVNLLGGRARSIHLHPFSWCELKENFNLEKALLVGLIPGIFFSDDPLADLKSYVGDYLKEEIMAEGAVRNIPMFSRFLQVAGFCHGKLINYEKIASDSRVAASTVRSYFQILRDTF